jgi:hypothetical protein
MIARYPSMHWNVGAYPAARLLPLVRRGPIRRPPVTSTRPIQAATPSSAVRANSARQGDGAPPRRDYDRPENVPRRFYVRTVYLFYAVIAVGLTLMGRRRLACPPRRRLRHPLVLRFGQRSRLVRAAGRLAGPPPRRPWKPSSRSQFLPPKRWKRLLKALEFLYLGEIETDTQGATLN